MWLWRNNNAITKEIIQRLVQVEAKLETYKQDVNSIRGLVNRKLGNSRQSEAGQDSETIKNDDGLDELRQLYHGKKKNSVGETTYKDNFGTTEKEVISI